MVTPTYSDESDKMQTLIFIAATIALISLLVLFRRMDNKTTQKSRTTDVKMCATCHNLGVGEQCKPCEGTGLNWKKRQNENKE